MNDEARVAANAGERRRTDDDGGRAREAPVARSIARAKMTRK